MIRRSDEIQSASPRQILLLVTNIPTGVSVFKSLVGVVFIAIGLPPFLILTIEALKPWANKPQAGWVVHGPIPSPFRSSNLRRIRHERKISQEGLAHDAGVDRAYLSRVRRAGP